MTISEKLKGIIMNIYDFGILLIPVGFILAGVIAYIGHKKKWKIMDYL